MKIITTVGTSLIGNNHEVDCNDLENESFSASKFEAENGFFKKYIKPKEDSLLKSINDSNASAELASLEKIDPDALAEVYLICTETVTSYMCGRVLQRHLGERAKVQYIEGLQVKDAGIFEEKGFLSLIAAVKNICENSSDMVVFNISGGYKALIPAMTLIAQLEKASLYYKFEDSDEIIEIANLPISFDWEVIEQYIIFLHNTNKRFNAPENILNEMRGLKLIKPDSCDLTIIGHLLSKYSDRASPFTEMIFGYFIEHKIYECFSSVYGRERVEHSVRLPGMSSEDIDILITPEDGQFVAIEIKPSVVLGENEAMNKVKNAFIERVKAAKTERGEPTELWLMVYSYTDNKNETRILYENEKEILEEVSHNFKTEIHNNIIFKVMHFFIESNKLGGERHIYQTFMKSPLKSEKIRIIFNSKEE